jgi:hypothetical protein
MSQDHSLMDQFHAKVLNDVRAGLLTGQVEELPPTTRWRLEYLCNHCAHLHAVTGTYEQVHMTMGIFMMLGYPMVNVKEEGFATICDMEGLDLSIEADMNKAAELYQSFCDEIRR